MPLVQSCPPNSHRCEPHLDHWPPEKKEGLLSGATRLNKHASLQKKVLIFRQSDSGSFEAGRKQRPVTRSSRVQRMVNPALYKWRSKSGSLDASLVARIKGWKRKLRP